jgi:two-component sensor histidine kinase
MAKDDLATADVASAALRDSRDLTRLAFEIAGACAWELNPTTGISIWDAAARKLLNLPDALLFDDAVARFVHPEDAGQVRTFIASALDPTGTGRYALEHRAAPGIAPSGERWLQSLGQAYFEGTGASRRPVRLVCVTTDVTERRITEERLKLLIDELNHRVKNTLGVVQALADQTRRATDSRPEGSLERRNFHADFQSRLLALARSHDLLTYEKWQGATLQTVIETAMQPFLVDARREGSAQEPLTRIKLIGPPVQVVPETMVALGMGMFELATNALKHGALSVLTGQVVINWNVDPAMKCVQLQWEERGGPDISGPPPPHRHGFGFKLLGRSLARQLGGDIRLQFNPDGLCCHMALPLKNGQIRPARP